MIDVLFPVHNRKAFTEFTLEMLLKNTNWALLDGGKLIVYDDASSDGAEKAAVRLLEQQTVTPWEFRQTHYCSPVAVMNDYIETAESEFFVKVDNDIVVPPNYLDELLSVITTPPYVGPVIELLGMEAGRTGPPPKGWMGDYSYEECSHIGGVGIMRTEALGMRPSMKPSGRFGFTEWQHEFRPLRAWIKPDLMVCSLDQVPLEPWRELAHKYVKEGYSRGEVWPAYHEKWMGAYWEWWAK